MCRKIIILSSPLALIGLREVYTPNVQGHYYFISDVIMQSTSI